MAFDDLDYRLFTKPKLTNMPDGTFIRTNRAYNRVIGPNLFYEGEINAYGVKHLRIKGIPSYALTLLGSKVSTAMGKNGRALMDKHFMTSRFSGTVDKGCFARPATFDISVGHYDYDRNRFSEHYRVMCLGSAEGALFMPANKDQKLDVDKHAMEITARKICMRSPARDKIAAMLTGRWLTSWAYDETNDLLMPPTSSSRDRSTQDLVSQSLLPPGVTLMSFLSPQKQADIVRNHIEEII